MTMLPVGRITSRAHSEVRSIFGRSVSDSFVSRARSAVVGARSWASPRSSGCENSRCAWATHGKDALMVAAVSRTPGRISRANARVGGKARLRDVNAALAFSSVGASSRIDVRRLPDWLARGPLGGLEFGNRAFG